MRQNDFLNVNDEIKFEFDYDAQTRFNKNIEFDIENDRFFETRHNTIIDIEIDIGIDIAIDIDVDIEIDIEIDIDVDNLIEMIFEIKNDILQIDTFVVDDDFEKNSFFEIR